MPSVPRSLRAAPAAPALAAALVALTLAFADPAPAATPRVHALTHARIVPAPGQLIEDGTVVIRDGLIVAVGRDVTIPADARIWDAESLTVYPGLIDAYVLPADAPLPPGAGGTAGPRRGPAPPETDRGAADARPGVRAETRDAETLELRREQLDA
ncbi:MAG TPA: hypothetical protein VMH61_03800, partial [Candidatus Acidoferrales bacterium]|nr:hypothetical protein [Candidatus Acidoferrales bacterium]